MALQIAQLLYDDETGEVIIQLPKNDGTGDSRVLVLNGRVAPEVCRPKDRADRNDDNEVVQDVPKKKSRFKKSD